MNAQEFSQIWRSTGDILERFDLKAIEKLDILKDDKEYYSIGLPQDAAPYLRFGPSSGAYLQSAADEYDLYTAYNVNAQ